MASKLWNSQEGHGRDPNGPRAERLAEILADVADTRVDLQRRLQMELAAQDGPARAANFLDLEMRLAFPMAWPALPDDARMIERRIDDVDVAPEQAELWAAKLRRRFPNAAHTLLWRAAAAAFYRRDFKACDRLSAEAETIIP